jgi:hypothetical protein
MILKLQAFSKKYLIFLESILKKETDSRCSLYFLLKINLLY